MSFWYYLKINMTRLLFEARAVLCIVFMLLLVFGPSVAVVPSIVYLANHGVSLWYTIPAGLFLLLLVTTLTVSFGDYLFAEDPL